ncbi:MAG: Maf family protein [Pseudomonadota bacterium]
MPGMPKSHRAGEKKLILASSSPRRRDLLKQIGLRFEVMPSKVEESIKSGEDPVEHVLRLAEEKALDVGSNGKDSSIIAADTIVLLNGEILGKPATEEEAYQMLRKLSGKEHRVITGFCVFNTNTKECTRQSVETTVVIKELSEREINGYVKTKEPFDKAGGYAIQGIGSFMVKEIRGSYTNVVGLPICELVEVLQRLGAIDIFDGVS